VYRFALSWDNPVGHFGPSIVPGQPKALGTRLPRYYTRFFGRAGRAAWAMASYALRYGGAWTARVEGWQADTLAAASQGVTDILHPTPTPTPATATATATAAATATTTATATATDDDPLPREDPLPTYYKSQLFNELYFLVDGGTLWLDTSDGVPNPPNPPNPPRTPRTPNTPHTPRTPHTPHTPHQHTVASSGSEETPLHPDTSNNTSKDANSGGDSNADGIQLPAAVIGSCDAAGNGLFQRKVADAEQRGAGVGWALQAVNAAMLAHDAALSLGATGPGTGPPTSATAATGATTDTGAGATTPTTTPASTSVQSSPQPEPNPCLDNNDDGCCSSCAVRAGDQRAVGQFLYLEGQEYLMYR
jgi:hypothetical protein